jgi:hypothetical protein
MTKPTLASVVADYGDAVKVKLTSPAATGEPEEQLLSPLEDLIQGIAGLCRFRDGDVVAVGETSLADLKVRPDFAVNVRKALVGFVEIKAPGKGADPRAFKGHDKEQWQKLQSLPNLLYTDGESFSLWRSGDIEGKIVSLGGDLRKAGRKLTAPAELLVLFESFLRWAPTPPRNVKELAKVTARLCRLLRDEVTEQLGLGCEALTSLAANWRDLLFPEATDEQFADGYAQAVTFGLLMARARGISIGRDLDKVGKELGKASTLIGAALRVLTDDAESEKALQTSLGTLARVLDAVNWATISKGKPDAWLYFYEDFLEEYDNALRKKTGSYYTPPEVVEPMVRLIDEAVRTRFGRPSGLAAPEVTIADPALGTGTFILQALRHIASTVENDQGAGAVQPAIDAAMNRIIGFELQLGPFAVAQLRIQAELLALGLTAPAVPMKMYVADTLANPWHDDTRAVLPSVKPIAEQRRTANKIKRETPITVVLGNPPYKEKAMGRGGWVESVERPDGSPPTIEEKLTGRTTPILEDWLKVHGWSAGAHGKHLRNLYVYFWRWATWKVFDQSKEHNTGIVSFITVSGFLTGPGFQMMREYLRKTADAVWVINCSPEGHQPDVPDRIFQGVQQPVCIVMASRSEAKSPAVPAPVNYVALPQGKREEKFGALAKLTLGSPDWQLCPADFRAPFMPEAGGDWKTYPALDELFAYNGSGVMPGRTWVIAPDADSLRRRWDRLIAAAADEQDTLFVPHLNRGKLGDRHVSRVVKGGLPGYPAQPTPIAKEKGVVAGPVQYAFRSFDRQWIIPDNRLLNRPNPELWAARSVNQVFLTAPHDRAATAGPAITLAAIIPDLHHYNGRGGRVFPLWRDKGATTANLPPPLLGELAKWLKIPVTPEDLVAYVAAVAACPAYTARFQAEMALPGLRIPMTADATRFQAAVEIGRRVIWLHTFGERFVDAAAGRPAGPPRLPKAAMPTIPKGGTIPSDPAGFPDEITYDAGARTLHVGKGRVENVSKEVWEYEVSGKKVVKQWFSYRKLDRERPVMGDRRAPSKLGEIQPDHWLADYTTELLNLLNVLGGLVALEPQQATTLDAIVNGPRIDRDDLAKAGAFECRPHWRKSMKPDLLLSFGSDDEGEEQADGVADS